MTDSSQHKSVADGVAKGSPGSEKSASTTRRSRPARSGKKAPAEAGALPRADGQPSTSPSSCVLRSTIVHAAAAPTACETALMWSGGITAATPTTSTPTTTSLRRGLRWRGWRGPSWPKGVSIIAVLSAARAAVRLPGVLTMLARQRRLVAAELVVPSFATLLPPRKGVETMR